MMLIHRKPPTSNRNSGIIRSILRGATALAVLTLLSTYAVADGTDAGTDISNQATVDYQVNGTNQPTEDSNDYTFKVDRKVDLTVAASGGTNVATDEENAVLKYTLTNTGNDTFDYNLAVENKTGDDFDATGLKIYIDSNDSGTIGTYDAGDTLYDEGANDIIEDLAKDASIAVFVVGDIPTGQTAGETSDISLKATALASGGSALTEDTGGDDPDVVQNVFADAAGTFSDDAAGDAAHSDTNTYTVIAADLTVEKSSEVLWDPVNETTNPLAIPQALVEYTITVTNAAGAATATDVTLADDLSTEIGNGTIAFYADSYASTTGIQLTDASGTITELTNDDDGDNGKFATNTVTVTGIELEADESATVKFCVWVTSEPDSIPTTVPDPSDP